MKKFILGVIVGVSITAAGSAYADDIVDSIVGKRVQGSFPVKVDGKQLTTSAAVIDGTSYLPVRAVGEALNKEVTFDADLGIELKEKGVAPVTEPNNATTIESYIEQNKRSKRIVELTAKINELTPLYEEADAKVFPYEHDVLLEANNIGKKEKDSFYQENVVKRDELKAEIEQLRIDLDTAIKENNDIAESKLPK